MEGRRLSIASIASRLSGRDAFSDDGGLTAHRDEKVQEFFGKPAAEADVRWNLHMKRGGQKTTQNQIRFEIS